ncbi:MAG TPA: glycosyltransferase [Gemmatimonadaceae bacterium]|nr:glycosyltransferase [Gemmatimonadaceae bacterium]
MEKNAADKRRLNILVVYSGFPARATLHDALFSFRRYSDHRVFYLNLRLKGVPRYVTRMKFDLVIFHALFFSNRFDADFLQRTFKRASPLAKLDAVKVILPQDEFINSALVNKFIRDFSIDCVFSVQPERVWDQVYDSIDRKRVEIRPILTGYLDDMRLSKIETLKRLIPRTLDIGYRTAGDPPAWFGRHGFLKRLIAEAFLKAGRDTGLKLDISTSGHDTLLGDDWYRFLVRCRYTLGVEGGTSILDRDGQIRRRTEAYQAAHPTASFEEIERACFPGVDGTFNGFAISPRHLEACAAGTCQILTEGHYNGILVAGRHYIPVKHDFSNVREVLERVRTDENGRRQMARRAYADIVESGKYTYQRFVNFVIAESMAVGSAHEEARATTPSSAMVMLHGWMRLVELGMRALAYGRSRMAPIRSTT